MMAMVIPAAKKTQTEVIKIISASTCGAKLDASGGYNGSCDCTILVRSLQIRTGGPKVTAPGNPDAPDEQENRQDAAEADNPKNGSAVLCARGVIVVAEQQNVVDGRANLSSGGVHKAQAHVAAGILDTIEVAGDAAARGQDHHAAGMSE